MENREEIKQKIKSMKEEELIDLILNKENEINKKEQEINWYKEQLALFNKLRFSSKSEKVTVGQLNLFNEAEDNYDHPVEEQEPTQKKVKKKKTREANFSKLPTKVIHHELEDTHCEVCGSQMKELAPQVIDVLKYQPARYTIERHVVHQYICPKCSDENLKAEIIEAEGAPIRLIKGSVVSSSVVAGIVFNKYVSGTPLYRQEQELKRKKIEISRTNMSNWLMKCGEMLEPLYELMQSDIKKLEHVHMDETTTTVLEDKKEEGREKSYMWMCTSGKYEAKQMALYYYNQSREHDCAKKIIGEDYAGSVHCDGYEAYHKLEKATVLGCMAHVRRKFVEAMEANVQHKQAKKLNSKELEAFCEENPGYGNIIRVIDRIRELFAYEAKYMDEGLDPEKIKERRQEEQKSKLDELFVWLAKYQKEYSAKSKMQVAITYAINQKEYLMAYLNDGKAEISNNRGERMIKPFVIGRKNWLFSKTKSGAKMSSIYYSLVESAKMNELDVQDYIEYILTQIQDEGKSIDYSKLLPYSSELPEKVRIK